MHLFISSSDPQLGTTPLLPPAFRRMMPLQAAMIQKAQGVVSLSACEYEPGAKEAVESTFGGKCFQVGYVCCIPMNLFVPNATFSQASIS